MTVLWTACVLVALGAGCVAARVLVLDRNVPGEGEEAHRPSSEVRFRPAEAGRSPWEILRLTRLPREMQETLAVLLLLPVGALVTALLRNIVGVLTFGTFAPSLLALSFLYADWRTGLIIFGLVTAIGLAGRTLLDRLRLLMVPRLSVVLAAVVVSAALAVSALDYFGLASDTRAVILPMFILTILIERFYISSEEDSLRLAAKLLAGTLLVGGVCLLVLRWVPLGRLALRYPEGELFVAAALLLVGRYSGYRLSELVRFRDLVRSRD